MMNRFVSYDGELGERGGARSSSILREGDAALEGEGPGGGEGCRSHLLAARRGKRRRLAMAAPCGTSESSREAVRERVSMLGCVVP
jgi:hypothetical protein